MTTMIAQRGCCESVTVSLQPLRRPFGFMVRGRFVKNPVQTLELAEIPLELAKKREGLLVDVDLSGTYEVLNVYRENDGKVGMLLQAEDQALVLNIDGRHIESRGHMISMVVGLSLKQAAEYEGSYYDFSLPGPFQIVGVVEMIDRAGHGHDLTEEDVDDIPY